MNTTTAAFRRATPEDVTAVLALMQAYYAEDGYAFEPDRSAALLGKLIGQDGPGALWVAAAGGTVVGYMAVTLGFSLEYGGRDAFLDELYLDVAVRGAGLGQAALALAADYCRANGVRALHLEVEPARAAAARLYERAGFERHDRILMTRRISGPDGDPGRAAPVSRRS